MTLGHSKHIALWRYLSNERNLKKQEAWNQFHKALTEYGELRLAEPVPEKDMGKHPTNSYYMPMHDVFTQLTQLPRCMLCVMLQPRLHLEYL